jgi:hypothetical protein
VELVGTLEPRATFRELAYLLYDRVDEAEFGRRLQLARQRRKQAPALFNPADPMQPNGRLEGFHPGVRNCCLLSAL